MICGVGSEMRGFPKSWDRQSKTLQRYISIKIRREISFQLNSYLNILHYFGLVSSLF
jgi:hypothetical protein